ncbi:class I SAM-dependent methyltransferase [Polynucleobacter sp.]|uniref:class I SAM-dependent methyltransferase n=1 Tax=Polynucleobacter sp. TaxID=2029855 RepID=UPI003F69D7E4
MSKKNSRGAVQKALDTLFFPMRALFAPEDSTFGLTSLRDERMEVVSKHAFGRVLDIGCGPGNRFVKEWADIGSVGIDVFGYEGVEVVHEDMTALPFVDDSFDAVTLIAVGGHIPQHVRVSEFAEIARVLKPGGRLLMTEGEPITQTVGHIWRHFSFSLIGKKDMDSERGMEEDEQYCMPYKEIMGYLTTHPLKLERQIKFMWGLNNLYIAKKE